VRLVRGDEAHGLRELMRRYLRGAVAVALEYTRDLDEAEDVAQEAFERVWRSAHHFDPRQRFRPWFYTIVRNAGRDAIRRRSRRSEVELSDMHAAQARDAALDADIRRHVHAELDRMTSPQASCFRLCEIEGFSAEEVADMMNIAPATVRTHAHRARVRLREALAKLGFQDNE